jgi:hypothetical protein
MKGDKFLDVLNRKVDAMDDKLLEFLTKKVGKS